MEMGRVVRLGLQAAKATDRKMKNSSTYCHRGLVMAVALLS